MSDIKEKMHQNRFRDPAGGAYSTPQDLLAVRLSSFKKSHFKRKKKNYRGPTFKGRRKGGTEGGTENEERERE